MQNALAHFYPIHRVVNEKGVKQPAFPPEECTVLHQATMVIIREEYIMEMDRNSGYEPGQNLVNDTVDLTSYFDRVCRIDKEQVIGPQFGHQAELCLLSKLFHQGNCTKV